MSEISKNWIFSTNTLDDTILANRIQLLSPMSNHPNDVIFWYDSGAISHDHANVARGVRPVLYLSSNVKITDGTGQESDPYKLGL
ncbi:MAG: hypothetical protein IJR82_05125 [Bacilli bacterium]|nr:hypothetical protein [Bacilli bacterium]